MEIREYIQSDTATNTIIPNKKHYILVSKKIPSFPIGGAEKASVAILCTREGYITSYSTDVSECDSSIFTPTAFATSNKNKNQGFLL